MDDPLKLPDLRDPRSFDEFLSKTELWRERLLAFARERGWNCETFAPFPDGSNLVLALGGDLVLKVFPPFHRHQWESDHRVLRSLQGRAPLSIPPYYESGAVDSWTYLLMGRLPGRTLEGLWETFDSGAKIRLLGQIGSCMRAVHELPVDDLKGLPPEWATFIQGQIAGAEARHRRLNLPSHFLRELPEFLDAHAKLILQEKADAPSNEVLLTGEYTPFNLMIADDQKPEIVSMIDFGDSMLGPADYDFLGPLAFLCEGHPAYVRALFEGYGKSLDQALRRRLFLLLILHRYSNFAVQIRVPDWAQKARNLEELEALILPLSPSL